MKLNKIFSFLRPHPGGDASEDRRPMTRELMNAGINDLRGILECPIPPDDTLENIVEWRVKQASVEWIEFLLDLLKNPPESAIDPVDGDNEAWLAILEQYLEEWVKQYPEETIARIGPLLEDEKIRPVLLEAMTEYRLIKFDGHIRWLQPLISQVGRLSRMDVINIIYALAGENLTSETQEWIKLLRTSFSTDDQKAQRIVDYNLKLRDSIF